MAKVNEKKLSFTGTIKWDDGKKATMTGKNKPDIKLSTPPEFKGPEGYWSPEDLFLASINSCIMTTFLHFVDRFSASFISYESKIEGKVNLQKGKLMFTNIKVWPHIQISDVSQKEKILKVMEKSEKYCLISSSVNTEIEIVPQIEISES